MKRALKIVGSVTLAVTLGLGLFVRDRYVTDEPAPHYEDPVEHFKYGSYGAEKTGLPYPIWKAIPELCKDMLPGGWEQLGFHTEPGRELPLGMTLRKYGVPRVGLNCAACHAGTMNGGPERGGQLILGMPSPKFDPQAYSRFVLGCVLSDRFTPPNVMAAIDEAGVDLPFYDRLVYRYFVVSKAREEAAASQQNLAWMHTRPDQGPGRTDTSNLFRMQLGQNPGGDTFAGPVDYPSLWNQGLRVKYGGGQHWDGGNTSYRERNYTSALASGATEDSIDIDAIERVSDWITDLPAAPYPYAVDAALAERGSEIWRREQCGSCHDFGAPRAGAITPLAEIGTDPGRQDAFAPGTAEAFRKLGVGKPWHITHYRKTDGYLNVWTDGVWARGPYLHNGSVPTLYDLLLPPAERPAEFYRGCDTFDPKKVGWKCDAGFRYRTDLPGNGNGGHLYGTGLPDDERWALVEYMKTL